jgi:hypothetical protein
VRGVCDGPHLPRFGESRFLARSAGPLFLVASRARLSPSPRGSRQTARRPPSWLAAIHGALIERSRQGGRLRVGKAYETGRVGPSLERWPREPLPPAPSQLPAPLSPCPPRPPAAPRAPLPRARVPACLLHAARGIRALLDEGFHQRAI